MRSSYNFLPKAIRKARTEYDFLAGMSEVYKRPKHYTQSMRDAAEARGHTMRGGGFPIDTKADLGRAKRAFGRAKNKPAARAHINRQARRLGVAPLGGDVGKMLLQLFGKADRDLTDGQSGGRSHSESDRVGVQDDRTEDQKNSSLLDMYNTAFKNPPMPGEGVHVWCERVFGKDACNKMYAEQYHMLVPLYRRARCLPSHTHAIGKSMQIKIEKAQMPQGRDLQHGLVWGWASVVEKDGHTITDYQGDQISEDDLMKAAHDYITNSRTGGALHLYCEDNKGTPLKCGDIVESMVFTHDLQKALGIDLGKVGWLIGYKITNDAVRKAAADGQLPSFSIGGAGFRTPIAE